MLLMIDNYDSFTYNLVQYFAELGEEVRTYRNDEITLEENQCLTCHGPDVYKKKNAPKIGDSHFLDRDGKKLATTSALRHNCVQCHVPQVDAPPLVENSFKGDMAESKLQKPGTGKKN